MSSVFSSVKHNQGWYRVIANPGRKMTFLVCECETREMADYLVRELNNQPQAIRSQLALSLGDRSANDEMDEELFFPRAVRMA